MKKRWFYLVCHSCEVWLWLLLVLSVTLTTFFYLSEEKALLLTLVVPENNGESKCERMNDANHRKCLKSLEEKEEGDEKERRRRWARSFPSFLYSSQSKEDLQFKRLRENLSLVSHHFSTLGNVCLLLGITFSFPSGRESSTCSAYEFTCSCSGRSLWLCIFFLFSYRYISFLSFSPDETKYACVCRANQEKSVLHESSSDLTVFMHTMH